MRHSTKIAIAAALLTGAFLFAVPNRTGHQPPRSGSLNKSLANARQIAQACRLYAVDHHGAFPGDLHELVPGYLPDRAAFSSPLAPKPGEIDYDYFGTGATDEEAPTKILLSDRYTEKSGGRSVVHFDLRGRIEYR